MSDLSQGQGWWLASDGKWYPPESRPYSSPPPRPSRTNGLAIASLVLSLTVFLIGPILAIIFGARARRQIRESEGLESGDGLALAGMIIGIVELVLSLVVVSIFVALIGTGSLSKLQDHSTAIGGAPGYWTTTGPVGLAFPEGRPWGESCQAIVFDIDDTLPGPQVILIEQAIQNARALGLDVTYAYPDNTWYPSALYPPGQTNSSVQTVNIVPSEQWPSPVDDFGTHEHIEFGWDARVSSNGRHEVLTDVTATLFLHAVTGEPKSTKRAVRELIAFSQGVAGSSARGSAISSGNTATQFTKDDINAMQRMSGCTFHPTATSHPNL
jgi:hypothetical protein